MDKKFKRVGTHSGRFHADEVMSTAILKELFDIEVVRSRDPGILNELDLIYDVGNGEFDHHQIDKKYREDGTPYAACGLIWNRFGRDVAVYAEPALTETDVEDLFRYVDETLIEGIDAADNGLRTCVTVIPSMNISSVIAEFNPPWDSTMSEDDAFNNAVQFASIVLRNTINQRLSVIRAGSDVLKAYNNRVRPEVLLLDRPYPWMQVLRQIDTKKEVLFVIYPRDSEYLIQTVRERDGTGDRKRLPLEWAGKRNEELNKVIGIEDAIFCHTARFIAGAGSLKSVLKMADLAIAEPIPEIEVQGFLDILKRYLLKGRVTIGGRQN